MRAVLNDPGERNNRIFNFPLSGIMQNGKRINYYDFISSLKDDGCDAALERIVPRIDMKRIVELIENTPYITDLQKEFYKTMISERKEKILDRSLRRMRNIDRDMER